MSAFQKNLPQGFSLVELMITIAIFSVTLTFGVSSYRTWVQNTQIRNAAESIQNGIQRARAEAVKRNRNVEFVLEDNSNWVVWVTPAEDLLPLPAGDGIRDEIERRSSSEGSKNVTVTVTPAGATTITLSNLGAVVANTDASATLTQVDLDSPVLDPADSRNLRVTIGLGGIVRMCDPDPGLVGKPQAC
ncbi:MAG: GspH/FimT family pseudopilin [Gallionella sp.]